MIQDTAHGRLAAAFALCLLSAGPAGATLDSTAVATGTGPGSIGTVTSEPVTLSVPVATARFSATVAIQPVSVAAGSDAAHPDGGDTLVARIAVTNTGGATLQGIAVAPVTIAFGTLPAVTLATPVTPAADAGTGLLAPGATAEFDATYELQQGDVDAAAGVDAGVTVTVGVAAQTAGGAAAVLDAASSTLTATTALPANPLLTLVKAAVGPNGEPVGEAKAGDVVTWRFTVTNTGNVTVSGVAIAEQNFNGLAGSLPLPSLVTGDTELSPGETAVFESRYTVGQQDVDGLQ